MWYGTFTDSKACAGPNGDQCTDGTQLTGGPSDIYDPNYDPYAACGGGGGANTGSGIQYQPGDYTNGETVDWSTGRGNGGSSVCGSTAIVEYVCIDTWNSETGTWEEWGCGYITTCS